MASPSDLGLLATHLDLLNWLKMCHVYSLRTDSHNLSGIALRFVCSHMLRWLNFIDQDSNAQREEGHVETEQARMDGSMVPYKSPCP